MSDVSKSGSTSRSKALASMVDKQSVVQHGFE